MFGGIFGRQKPSPAPEVTAEVAEALVRADETVRRGTDELGYATAEFGEVDTRELAAALTQARTQLREAFRLNGLLLDDEPETPQQRQQLEAGVLATTAEVDRLVRGPASEFATRRAALRDAPTAIARLRAETGDVAGRVAEARSALATLTTRYSEEAIVAVADNPDQAEALLQFTERSLGLAERRHTAGRGEEATKAIRVASDSIRRADELLDAVTDYEVEAVHAESTLTAVLADSRSDIVEARHLLAAAPDHEIEGATAALDEAVAAAATGEAARDPFTTLSRLRAANEALDRLVRERRSRPERERLRAHLEAALADADRQVALARTLIADHPGSTGPDSRTRLAQAERLLGGVTLVEDPQAALSQGRQAADLAAEAAALARRDLEAARMREQEQRSQWGGDGGWGEDRGSGWGGGYGGGRGRRGGFGAEGVLGGVLGGMVLGGILDGLDDFDFDFD
ncbi:hypothetical protein EXU48_08830 [Occultella glacieicola]|uniref:Uncharacterized protein n=1 Tax=Occultella glacieicola TaxID=2518684 RepID=A0ABY2E4Z6_9MICO|nr:hypothetical protein [Occultella glacieicola]TDE94883.1 hypothetical protein EXU48_08830 [Occultella glacieicola]